MQNKDLKKTEGESKNKKNQKIIIFVSVITIIIIIGIAIGANAIRIGISNEDYNSSNSSSNNGNLLPEYIKAGITLGGVTGTLEDLDTSDATATEWDISYGKTAYVDGEKITGLFVPRDSLEIGDYVDYTPDTASDYSLLSSVSGYSSNQTISQETELKWQILSISDDETIELTSNEPTSYSVYFRGSLGYNNAVYVMNDIMRKLYSNIELEANARSINIKDIESKMTDEGINARNNSISPTHETKYGTIISHTYNGPDDNLYPKLYAQEIGSGTTGTIRNDGISTSDPYYSSPTKETYEHASNGLRATETYYYLKSEKGYFLNEDWRNLIFKQQYWIASRCVDGSEVDFSYGMHYVGESNIGAQVIYNNWGNVGEYGLGLRPIVTLNSNITLFGGDGSEEHPYQLTK